MRIKRIHAVKIRKKKIVRILLLVILIAAAALFVRERRDFLISQARQSLEALLSRESDLEVRIGRIGGNIFGLVRFEGVRVLNRKAVLAENRVIFSAKEISLNYRLLDFLSKKNDSKITAVVRNPRFHWRPRIALSPSRDVVFMSWLRDWALNNRNDITILVHDLHLFVQPSKMILEGIDIEYENGRLAVELPLRHLPFGGMDLSTVLKAEGIYRMGFFGRGDTIEGDLMTEGTVVNWTPMAQECQFHFSFGRSGLKIESERILGGLSTEAEINFKNDYDIYWNLTARNYPVSNLSFLFKNVPANMLRSRVDLDLSFEGSPLSPNVSGRARIYDGLIGKKTYKAMDLQFNGVYPTVNLQNSRILLQDEIVMKFADKTLEFRELFREKTYEGLVNEAQQETVVWGEWEFQRPRDINDERQFVVKHALGEGAGLHFRDYKRDEPSQDPDRRKMEVGVEYKLPGKNSLKMELREDEKFVGIEKKVKF